MSQVIKADDLENTYGNEFAYPFLEIIFLRIEYHEVGRSQFSISLKLVGINCFHVTVL